MDLVDVFVLLMETDFVQTNYKIIKNLFWDDLPEKEKTLIE